ncbi:hypothetical protein Pmar_PMAR013139 [Perkinsus marinus ATCC 50983]|uniref:Uncharacterized protein n=1 Tax=Perkinsus marinus (strain ATCC 50983 / TXsc) TaxID=423536 RepID=C5L504_PERM5|nr:hypothetical protein Pmar_PMAR013139 [Perkinsus marinus ATCC 50983]EER08224.1 hypothetical protein Pmar_PMAR013139 [Perkinsus marinus ATCC 50983]|eukprot:XP_002776408.1 hypothetical protein Pmar_PMAR013139 [Perkinsus marinus ATCC 50983]
MEPYGAQMGCITDRPALAAFLVAAASMRILVTLCLASQSSEAHLLTAFSRGRERSIESDIRLVMESLEDVEEATLLSSALAVKEKVAFSVHGQGLSLGIFPAVYRTSESPVAIFGRAGTLVRYSAVWMETLFIIVAAEIMFNICSSFVVGIAAVQARLDGQRYFHDTFSLTRSQPVEMDGHCKVCAAFVDQVSADQWRLLRHPLGYIYLMWLVGNPRPFNGIPVCSGDPKRRDRI